MAVRKLDDLEAALAAMHGGKAPVAKSEAKARHAREKNFKNPNDGRRKRRIEGPTAQLNVAIAENLRDRLVVASRVHGRMIVVMVEGALEDYLAKLEKGARGA